MDEHVTTAELDELRQPALFVRPLSQLVPVIHLARSCPQCWAAANALPEFEYHDNTQLSGEPVIECLRRLGASRSWTMLSADHRAALVQMREKPLGIAFVVAHEASDFLGGAHPCGEEYKALMPQAFASGFLLAERLEQILPGDAAVADVHARLYSLLALYFAARGRAAQARASYVSAERHTDRGSGELAVCVILHEVDLLLARDAETAEETTSTALELVGAAPSWRRFELYQQLHRVLVGLESPPDQQRRALEHGFVELDKIKLGLDQPDRIPAIFHGSLLICQLSQYLSDEELTTILETALAEIEAEESLDPPCADSFKLRLCKRLLSRLEVTTSSEDSVN